MAHPKYRGTTIELRAYSPMEKAEIDVWADKHGEPTSTFLIAQIRDLMDAESQKRKKPYLNREAKLLVDLASLKTELRETKARLHQAEGGSFPAQCPRRAIHELTTDPYLER